MKQYYKICLRVVSVASVLLGCIVDFVMAQCPIANFNIPDTVCIRENISITNQSIDAENYIWDFNSGDFEHSVNDTLFLENNTLLASFGFELVRDNDEWYGFATSSSRKEISRFDFSNTLDFQPVVNVLTTNSPHLDNPRDVSVLQYNGQWYGFVGNNTDGLLRLLSFGESLKSTPTISVLNNAGTFSKCLGLEAKIVNNELVIVLTNGSNVEVLIFDDGLQETPQKYTYSVPNSNTLFGLSLIQECETWYALIASFNNEKIFQVSFTEGFLMPPEITELTGLGISTKNPTDVMLVEEGGQFYGFIQRRQGKIIQLTYGSSLSNMPSAKVLNNLPELTSNLFALQLQKIGSKWVGLSTDMSVGKMFKLNFENIVKSNIDISYSHTPYNVHFIDSGTFKVSLEAIDVKGNHTSISKNITVIANQAPDLDVTFDSINCINSSSLYTVDSENEKSSFIWSFGDGNTATGQDVLHQYASPGTYEVTLEVETPDGCGNRLTKEVTIYEPPESKFTVDQSVVCTNGAVQFTNLSDIKGASDVITYEWSFNGEGSSTDANPVFTFTTGGTKTVSLTTTIPGCSNTYDTTFTVVEGPVVDFSTSPQICQGEEVTFENLTSGDNITAYQWSFGDGGSFSSITKDNPVYTYDSAGTYLAVLEVSNASACETSLTKTLTVYSRPAADFSADIACAGAPTQFVDESTTGINSNIVAWDWIFGDGEGSSKARNPQYTYDVPGLYEATLVVLTSAGCQDTIKKEIVVESAVQASFTNQQLCPSETEPFTIQFADASTSTNGEKVTEWLWTINGENFVIANPSYTFDKPGTYQVSLTVFSNSACNASVTRNVTVKEVPEADFAFEPKCAGSEVIFTNLSQHEGVEVTSYQWNFGGEGASFEENPAFIFDEEGTYKVSLTLETAEACSYTVEKEVVIPAQPNADFSTDVTYGGAPLTVNFVSNTSEASSDSYRWQFGDLASAQQKDTTFTFTQPGTYTVSLEVSNTLGCSDISTQTINVVEPVSDLQLERVSVLSEEGDPGISMLLTIRNNGTLKAGQFSIDISLDQVLNISKIFDRELGPGEVVNFPLDFSVSTQQSRNIDLKYICATLENLPEEENLANNRYCTSLENNFTVISPYPNPSKDKIQVDLVLPQQENVDIKLMTIQGETLQNLTFSNTKTGLNTFTLDVSTMVSGYYLLQVDYLTYSKVHRLVVNP